MPSTKPKTVLPVRVWTVDAPEGELFGEAKILFQHPDPAVVRRWLYLRRLKPKTYVVGRLSEEQFARRWVK